MANPVSDRTPRPPGLGELLEELAKMRTWWATLAGQDAGWLVHPLTVKTWRSMRTRLRKLLARMLASCRDQLQARATLPPIGRMPPRSDVKE